MKKTTILLALIIAFGTIFGQTAGEAPAIPERLNDYGILSISFTGAKTGNVSRPNGKYKRFDPKKDDINNVFIETSGYSRTEYEIIVAHKNGKACDMNEFNVRFECENMISEEIDKYYKYSIKGNTFDYLDGTFPTDGDIVITHIESNLSTRIHYTLNYVKEGHNYSRHGLSHNYLFEPIQSNVYSGYYVILDLTDKEFLIVQNKGCIDASGRDGRDGKNGAWGINGMNECTWTDKNGKTHYSPGTAGTRGADGENGEDGWPGGHSYVYVGPGCADGALTVKYQGGRGGKGGKGGIGGTHGKGSGLKGSAPNGSPGRDGRNGANGDVEFDYISEGNLLINSLKNENTTLVSKAPYILIDKTVKLKKTSRNKKSATRTDSNTVDF